MLKKKVFIFSAIILAILVITTFLITIFVSPQWPKEISLRFRLISNPHLDVNETIMSKLAGPAKTEVEPCPPQTLCTGLEYDTYSVNSFDSKDFGRIYSTKWSGNIAGGGPMADGCIYNFYDAEGNFIVACSCLGERAPILCKDLLDLNKNQQ